VTTTWIFSKLDDWVTFDKIELGRGDIISKDDINANPGPYPIYSSSTHNNGKFGEYDKYMFDEELITWSVDGGGNLFYRPKHKFSVTNVCGYMRVKANSLHAPFIYYCLAEQHSHLTFDYTTKAHPSVIRRLYQLPEIGIRLQKKIARILQTIDQAIEKTEVLIEKYQQIKAGLMHDLFTRGIGADGKLRPPREEAPDLYQETPIGWIPREWEFAPITACANVIDPNPSHRNPIYHGDGFPFISTVEFREFDHILLDTPRRVIEAIVDEQERRCKFNGSSIAFSRKGTIGEIRLLPTGLRFALLDSLCVINPTRVNHQYLFFTLRSNFLKKQIKNLTVGQALPQLSIGRVRELLIPKPISDFEQQEIARILGATYTKTVESGEQLQKFKSIKSGLMHDLLTGKVQVKVEAEQPEAVHV
jgi:type I restriction enzyme S subunit